MFIEPKCLNVCDRRFLSQYLRLLNIFVGLMASSGSGGGISEGRQLGKTCRNTRMNFAFLSLPGRGILLVPFLSITLHEMLVLVFRLQPRKERQTEKMRVRLTKTSHIYIPGVPMLQQPAAAVVLLLFLGGTPCIYTSILKVVRNDLHQFKDTLILYPKINIFLYFHCRMKCCTSSISLSRVLVQVHFFLFEMSAENQFIRKLKPHTCGVSAANPGQLLD